MYGGGICGIMAKEQQPASQHIYLSLFQPEGRKKGCLINSDAGRSSYASATHIHS